MSGIKVVADRATERAGPALLGMDSIADRAPTTGAVKVTTIAQDWPGLRVVVPALPPPHVSLAQK